MYGDIVVTEERIQNALAQFIRSMQSFDSKYDVGRAQVGNNNADFPNFTTEENNGKSLYMDNAGAGCNRCHRAPEFDIDPNSKNNGVIGVAGSPGSIDVTNERSPSLRDIVDGSGNENGPFMHDGSLATLMDVIDHYDNVPNLPANTNLDNRLTGPGGNLNLTTTEKNELHAFMKTLGSFSLYTDKKWSDPFDASGNLIILNGVLPVELAYFNAFEEDGDVLLEWETYEEINNDGFEIMYSMDAQKWNALDFVLGENEPTTYDYLHGQPGVGSHYYRLKQVDFDGRFTFSDIQVVRIEQNEPNLTVYPNPTQDYLTINTSDDFDTAILYNVNGHVIKEAPLSQSVSMDLTDLPRGTYFMKVAKQGQLNAHVQKIVKL